MFSRHPSRGPEAKGPSRLRHKGTAPISGIGTPGRTASTLTSHPLGILSSRGGRIREAPCAGRMPAHALTIAYPISDVKNYFEPIREQS